MFDALCRLAAREWQLKYSEAKKILLALIRDFIGSEKQQCELFKLGYLRKMSPPETTLRQDEILLADIPTIKSRSAWR